MHNPFLGFMQERKKTLFAKHVLVSVTGFQGPNALLECYKIQYRSPLQEAVKQA